MKRRVVGLRWAREIPRPSSIPRSRPRGKKAFGTRYEKEIERALPAARRGVWFEFADLDGPGLCEVDFLLPSWPHFPIVLEAKYTWTEVAHVELEKLYLPIVEAAYGVAAVGVVVCHSLLPAMGNVVVAHDLRSAVQAAQRRRSVLHWIGKIPLIAGDRA